MWVWMAISPHNRIRWSNSGGLLRGVSVDTDVFALRSPPSVFTLSIVSSF